MTTEQQQLRPPQDKYTVQQFAAKIKAKYPMYKDLEDSVLVDKIVAKYPEYKSKINFDIKATPKQQPPQATGQPPKQVQQTKVDENDPIGSVLSPLEKQMQDLQQQLFLNTNEYIKSGESTKQKPVVALPAQNDISIRYQDSQKQVRKKEKELAEVGGYLYKNTFKTGKEAAKFLEGKQVNPGNRSHKIALEKIEKAEKINSLLDSYSVEEAAARINNPKLNDESYFQYVKNSNARAGHDVFMFFNDPDVLQRAKDDPKVAQQLREAQANYYNHYPKAAEAQLASKISEYRSKKGYGSWFYDNPDEEDIDKVMADMRKDGLVNNVDEQAYKNNLRPKLASFFQWEKPLKTFDFANNFAEGTKQWGTDVLKTIKDTENKLSFGALKKGGLFESDENERKRLVNESYSVNTATPQTTKDRLASSIGHLSGYILPMVLTQGRLQGAGMSAGAASNLVAYASFEGANAEDARMTFPDSKSKQLLYTGLSTLGDMYLMHFLPMGKTSTIKKEIGEELKGIVSKLTNKQITESAARSTVLNIIESAVKKSPEFAKNVLNGNIKTANVMTGFQVMHQGLKGLMGGSDKSLMDNINEDIQAWKTNFISSSLLSTVHAAQGLPPKLQGNNVREVAENADHYSKIIESLDATPEQKAELMQNLQDAVMINNDIKGVDGLTQGQKDKYLLSALSRLVNTRKAENIKDDVIRSAIEKKAAEAGKTQVDIIEGKDKAEEFETFTPKKELEKIKEFDEKELEKQEADKDDKILKQQEKLGLPSDPEVQLSDKAKAVESKINNGEDILNEDLNLLSDELYDRYKALSAVKNESGRRYTRQQYDNTLSDLERKIDLIERHKNEQADKEDFIKINKDEYNKQPTSAEPVAVAQETAEVDKANEQPTAITEEINPAETQPTTAPKPAEKLTLEQEHANEIKKVKISAVEDLNFVPDKDLVKTKDPREYRKKQAGIKKEFKKLQKLIECLTM